MQLTYDFLKKCGTYYLATDEGGQPRVRPFGTIHIYNGRLCFQTGAVKDVSRQLHSNPKFEICAFSEGKWIRLSGTAALLDDVAAQESMLDAYPELRDIYKPGDGNTEIWYVRNARSTIASFGEPPVTEEF